MSYDSIIDAIKFKGYSIAADEMFYEALGEKIHSFTQKKGTSVIRSIAKELKSMHLKLQCLRRFSKTPTEIAEKVYEQTREAVGLDKFDDIIKW